LHDWKNILLSPSDSLERAIEVLNKEALQIVLVVDDSNKLLGTITDGDIRRALVRHVRMDDSINAVMRSESTTVSIGDSRRNILALMKSKSLLQVPVLDVNGCVVGLETLVELINKKQYDNPVFLMAGGFGKRLRPLTDTIPKPLLKINSQPILENILEKFIEAGFHNFYISTHYKADMVRDHFGNGDTWGVNINYVYEDEPLGTAGALGLLPGDMPDLPILMMNGDLLTKVNIENLLHFHQEQDGIATMCVRKYDFQVPYGVIKFDDCHVKSIVEKPIYNFFVNAGIYVLNQSLVKSVNGLDYLDMPNLLEQKIECGEKINMFPIHEYWLDIGQIEEFEHANKE
jgi:dTDP-glucose pyrophosphorylase/predicted transcriptional regulator